MKLRAHVTTLAAATLSAVLLAAAPAQAQDTRIAYVNFERIVRDGAPAKAAQSKLEAEFGKRERDLRELGAKLKAAGERLDKDSAVMAEAERQKRQREVAELDREFQRRQREFSEDLNQRRNEELSAVMDRAQRVVRQIAESEKYDLVLVEAAYASPRIDITEKVIKALGSAK